MTHAAVPENALYYQEAATFLGMTYDGLRKVIVRGGLHPFRPPRSGKKMIYKADLERFKRGEQAGKGQAQEPAQAPPLPASVPPLAPALVASLIALSPFTVPFLKEVKAGFQAIASEYRASVDHFTSSLLRALAPGQQQSPVEQVMGQFTQALQEQVAQAERTGAYTPQDLTSLIEKAKEIGQQSGIQYTAQDAEWQAKIGAELAEYGQKIGAFTTDATGAPVPVGTAA